MGKFFKIAEDYKTNPALEKAITSRIGLEGSRDPKTIKTVSYYNTVKNVPYLGDHVKSKVIANVKKKHGPFIRKTFGNVSDKKFKQLADTSIRKVTVPNIRTVHTADSLNLVHGGQTYPKHVDKYFTKLKKKRDLKVVKAGF